MTVFDASKCRAMLDDFAARKNDIFVDRRHEVVDATSDATPDQLLDRVDAWGQEDGRALAWADALCMVVAGVVVRYVRHASAPETAPTLEDLQRPDGTNAEDGVYARRFRVTPLGADPKEGLLSFRYTSPYFVPREDGWRLLNYTVTNDPRMEGVGLGAAPLAMQSSGCVRMGRQQMEKVAMAKQASAVSGSGGVVKIDGRQAYWFSPKDLRAWNSSTEWDLTQEQANQLAREAPQCNADNAGRPSGDSKRHDRLYNEGGEGYNPYRKMDNSMADMTPEEKAEMMKAAGCMDGDSPDMKHDKMMVYARKMAEDCRTAMEVKQKMESDAADMKRKMEADKAAEASKMAAEHKEPDGDEPEKMQAMSRRLSAAEEKNRMLADELKEVRNFGAQFKAQQERLAADNAKAWAQNAVSMRRVKPSRCGTEEQTVAWLAAKRLKEGDGAEDVLCDVGTFGEPEALLMSRRIIENGAPAGAPDPREGGLTVDDEMSAAIAKETKALIGAGEDPKKKDLYRMSMQRIAKSNPSLHRRFLAANGSN